MQKILIVDDDEDFCEELSEILEGDGYAVDVAFDGLQGKERIRDNSYNLVVLDLKLPKANGFEMLQHIKHSYPDLKVFILSGRPFETKLWEEGQAELDEEERILRMADCLINKPFQVEFLLKKIRQNI